MRTHAPRLLEGYDARLGQGGDNQPAATGAEVALLPVGVQAGLLAEGARLLGVLQETVIEPHCTRCG